MIEYERIVVGDLQTNCYLLRENGSKKALIVDPGDDEVEISEIIQNRQITPIMIILTHGHFDHVLGAIGLKLIYKTPIAISFLESFFLERTKESATHFLKRKISVPNIKSAEINLDKLEQIRLGDEIIKVIKTPGHTPGSVSLYAKDSDLLITGDTLFANGLRGDTKHQYSSTKLIYRSICNLLTLPKNTKILPGHGDETTIAETKPAFNCDYCELPDSG